MATRRITTQQFEDRMEYLTVAANADLLSAWERAENENNWMPLREKLIKLGHYHRECALFLEGSEP